MSNVAFLPGWHYTPTKEEEYHFDFLQDELLAFREEINYQAKDMTYAEYVEYKEMRHIRLRQIIGVVKKIY